MFFRLNIQYLFGAMFDTIFLESLHCHLPLKRRLRFEARCFERKTNPHRIGGSQNRSKQSTNADQKSIESVFDCHLCSNDFCYTFVDSNNVFDCLLSGV